MVSADIISNLAVKKVLFQIRPAERVANLIKIYRHEGVLTIFLATNGIPYPLRGHEPMSRQLCRCS
jgi:hypothetical protein